MNKIYVEGFSFCQGSPEPGELLPWFDARRLRRMEEIARMALLCSCRALDMAGQPVTAPKEMGLSLGVGAGSLQSTCKFMDSILEDGDELSSPTAFAGSVHNSTGLTLSLFLGLRGPCVTSGQFDSSFGAAFLTAVSFLRSGMSARALLVAADDVNPVTAALRQVRPGAFDGVQRGAAQHVPPQAAAAALVLCARETPAAKYAVSGFEFSRTGEKDFSSVPPAFSGAAEQAVGFCQILAAGPARFDWSDAFLGVRTRLEGENLHAYQK